MIEYTFEVKASRRQHDEHVYVRIETDGGFGHFWLSREQAYYLADRLLMEAGWLDGLRPPLRGRVAEYAPLVSSMTNREIADELAGIPPRYEYPRSEAYLAALRDERDRRERDLHDHGKRLT